MTDLSNSAVFPLGQENTGYAQYFVGKSYLNMPSTQGAVIGNVTIIPPREKQPVTLRVAAYCCASSNSAEQLNSYDAQKAYYTQKIRENPDWEMAGIFADRGITRTSL